MKCQLQDITVNYQDRGQGAPFVLFHGWNSDHRAMMGPLEHLFENRPGWRRIYVDLPGMGETPGMDWIENQDQVLDILLDFIDAVLPGERFALAGYSYGGYLARGVVHRRLSAMDGLFLLAPTIILSDSAVVPPQVSLVKDPVLVAKLEREHGLEFRERFETFSVVQSQQFADRMLANHNPRRLPADAEYLARLARNYVYSFDVDALDEPFPAPALVVTGRQDSSVGYHDAYGVIENYPRGTWAILDRAGHVLQYEQTVLFEALVNEWLDRVEEYRAR